MKPFMLVSNIAGGRKDSGLVSSRYAAYASKQGHKCYCNYYLSFFKITLFIQCVVGFVLQGQRFCFKFSNQQGN